MFPTPGSTSAAVYERACKVMPGGTSRRSLYDMRSYVHSGLGCRVRDVDGNSLLDGSNNFMVLVHGHGHPPTVAALMEQLDRGISFGMAERTEVLLAEHLCSRVAGTERVIFCSSGSEAVMHAIKAARALTKRPKIVKCEGLYHGSYDYAEVSNAPPVVPGSQGFPRALPYGPYTLPHVLDDTVVIPFNDAAVAEAVLREQADRIAGIVIDLVPSRIGYAPAEQAFVEMLRRVCDEFGIVLIFDEVASFRVGHGGAQGMYDVIPDLTAFGKIIGGGLPVGAVGGTQAAMRIFDASSGDPTVSFTGTFNANPMSMTAGLATMEDLTPGKVIALNKMGDRARAGIAEGIKRKGLPATVRGFGSFVSLFFGPRVGNTYHSVAHRPEELATLRRFWSATLDRGMLIDVSGRFNLSTAYTEGDVDEATEIVVAALEEAFGSAAPSERTRTLA